MRCPRCDGTGVIPEGQELKLERIRHRVKLKDVAEKMGISASYLCHLEKGRRLWTKNMLIEFRNALRVL
jgi:transcriptional regulator with XRE-family HTH domain